MIGSKILYFIKTKIILPSIDLCEFTRPIYRGGIFFIILPVFKYFREILNKDFFNTVNTVSVFLK